MDMEKVPSSKFASKSLLQRKLKEAFPAKSKKPSFKGARPSKLLSKFMKRLSFRIRNCTNQNHKKNKFSGGDDASVCVAPDPETPVSKKFESAWRNESFNFSPKFSRNQRFEEAFLYAGGEEVMQRTCNGMYFGILVIAILAGLLQSRIFAMLCSFACSLLFNAMEIASSRRAVPVAVNRCN